MSDWISVRERLPETAGEYLVVYHSCYWDAVREELRVGIDTFRGKTAWAKKNTSVSPTGCPSPNHQRRISSMSKKVNPADSRRQRQM